MKKIVIIISIIIVLVLLLYFLLPKFFTQNLQSLSDSQVIAFLNKNQDSKDYMSKNPDFKIEKKEILTKESILNGQNGQNFKEMYQGLSLENNRYMEVELMNGNGSMGLIVILDFKLKNVANSALLMLAQVSVGGK